MIDKRLTAAALLAALGLAACASQPTSASSAPGGVTIDGRTVFQTLPPQDVRANQCPLILFTREETSRRILVALDHPAIALARIDNRTTQFARTSASGRSRHGHTEIETFATPDGETIVSSIEFGPPIADDTGAPIRSASLSYTSAGGESVVIPVVGLVSCAATAENRG